MQSILNKNYDQLSKAVVTLEAINPLKVLSRGYAIATPENGTKPIRSVKEISPSQRINVLFSDGQTVCYIEDIKTMK